MSNQSSPSQGHYPCSRFSSVSSSFWPRLATALRSWRRLPFGGDLALGTPPVHPARTKQVPPVRVVPAGQPPKATPKGPKNVSSIFAIGSFREEQGSGQQVGRSSERITLTHTHHGGVGRGNEVDGAEDSAAEGEEPSVRSAHTVREPGASIEEENGPRADLTVLPPAYPPPPPPSRSRPRRAPGTRRAGRRG